MSGHLKAAFTSFLCCSLHDCIAIICHALVLLTQHRSEIPLCSQHRDKFIHQGGKDERRRRWIIWEACSSSNNFLLVHWDFSLPQASLCPKIRHRRPQGGLVLGFSVSVRCHCHLWGGKGWRCSLCPPAWWGLRIPSAALSDNLSAPLPRVSALCLLPRTVAAHLFLPAGLPNAPGP